MAWNPAVIDGPIAVATFGAPEPVGPLAIMVAAITGYDDRYHLNLPEAEMTEALEAFRVTPDPPTQVIAGEATAFLRFDDEAAAIAALPDHWTDDPAE